MHLYGRGEYNSAVKFGERALNIRCYVLGENNDDTVMAMNSLGLVLRKFEDIECKQKVEDLYRRALSVAERLHGPDSAPMLIHKQNLAITLLKRPHYEEATNMLQSVLNLGERFSSEEDPNTLVVMTNLGLAHLEQEDYQEAESTYRKLLTISLRVQGDKHPSTMGYMNDVAVVLYKQCE